MSYRWLLLVVLLVITPGLWAIDAGFPVEPGTRSIVSTQLWPDEQYDIYIPTGYSATGVALPLMFTLSPGSGGLVSDFRTVGEEKQIIIVGLLDSKNSRPYKEEYPNNYAVLRDIMERLNYDPTAVYAAGFSGGAWSSYDMTKFFRPHLTGVLAMGGWLGGQYYNYDRYRSGLLVARTTGTNDTAAYYYLPLDRSYLERYGVIISDYTFSGGHRVAPVTAQRPAIDWLLENRAPAEEGAYEAAQLARSDWEARLAAGDELSVYEECVNTLLNEPLSYLAREAQLVVWQMMDDYESFSLLETEGMFSGDFANDLFWGIAFGAAYLGDLDVYYSASMSAERVSNTAGDFLVDTAAMLTDVGYPSAIARFDHTSGAEFNTGENSFDATPSIAPWRSINSYMWDFGDGTQKSGLEATHTFTQNGNYMVTLTVLTPDGSFESQPVEVVVGEPAQITTFTAEESINIRDALDMSLVASHRLGIPLTYELERLSGPGSVEWSPVQNNHATARFQRPGTYQLQASVTANGVQTRRELMLEVLPDDWDDDRDGLSNSEEDLIYDGITQAGESNRWHPDQDDDGLWDAEERLHGTDPLVADAVFALELTTTGTREWSTGFESAEGYDPGAVDGQLAWRNTTGGASIGASGTEGTRGLEIDGSAEVEAYWGVQRANRVTFEFSGQLNRGGLRLFEEPVASAAVFMLNEEGYLCAYNGQIGEWYETTILVPIDSMSEYSVELDYDSKTWSLAINSTTVLTSFPFANPDLQRFSRFKLTEYEGNGQPALLDDLRVTARQPYLNWLAEHFTSIDVPIDTLSESDPDDDGNSTMIEYVFGSNPRVGDRLSALPRISLDGSVPSFQFEMNNSDIDFIVECSPDLSPGSWTPVSFAPTSGDNSHEIPLSDFESECFYRVSLQNLN